MPTRTNDKRVEMRKLSLLLILISLAGILPSTESYAQSALRGAVIGGAVGGRRGAAIGAAAGAVAGAHRRHHWHSYYWRNGSCWYRSRNGRSHRVSHRYCR
ncbi:glycine zipper domain-containing protein [Bradyrhizobium sp. LB11.1]|uniref:glycine zipper domain-containing protein n=1 Tax=Bradyrhizobium sp. LB11.1 TaxID=3156326 RepID=UPI003398D3D6